MQCPKCSSENPVGSSVCQSCSTPLTAESQPVGQDTDYAPWKTGASPQPGAAPASKPMIERPRMAQASKTSGQKSSVAAPVIILVVLAIIAAWWFLLANPSPVPAAKGYVTEKLNMFAGMMPAGVKPEAGSVKDVNVTGDRAVVSVDIKTSMMGINTSVAQRLALVKEGSFFAKKWRVDEAATMQLQIEDAGKMMNQFRGMMNQNGAQGQMPGMPPGFGKMSPNPQSMPAIPQPR